MSGPVAPGGDALPHRHPFLALDRVESVVPGESAVAWRAITGGAPSAPGHFPGDPIEPGVMIVESLAQLAGVSLSASSAGAPRDARLAAVHEMRFRRPLRPGDLARISVWLVRRVGALARFRGEVTIDGDVAVEGEVTIAVAERGS